MSEKIIFRGRIFSVLQKVFSIKGKDYIRDIVEHPGGAAVLVIHQGKVLLVEQTRAGANSKMLEIPAGTLDPNESARICAIRELNEECSLTCEKMELISRFYPTPGYCTEQLYIFHASGIRKAEKQLEMDESEDITTVWMPLQEAYEKIQNEEIFDGKTIIAIQWAMLHQQKD